MRRALAALLASGLTLVSTIGLAESANAAVPPFSGCRYSGSDPTLKIAYSGSLVEPHRYALVDAANRWNRTPAPGAFSVSQTGANIRGWTEYSSETYWAVTVGSCGSDIYWDTTVDIWFNSRTFDALSTYQKSVVAVHELGHAYGLAHVQMNCGGRPSVMEQGEEKFGCPLTPPWNDDVIGVQNIY